MEMEAVQPAGEHVRHGTAIARRTPIDAHIESGSGRWAHNQDSQYSMIKQAQDRLSSNGMSMPYFVPHEGVNKSTTCIGGRTLINFASYNYLGLSGHAEIARCAKDAIDRFGTSVSASRLVSGEIPLHAELEKMLASLIGADDCLLYVGGHATNVSTIGHLFGPDDLILHDAHIHNSALEGCRLSGARRMSFRHNNVEHLDILLARHRDKYRQAIVIVEGVYSMEGDIADLPRFIESKKRFNALLMVDEAHSVGVLGKHGRGIGEYFGIDPHDVDLWMGTLSKSLASCGGYIAGSGALVEYLKYTSPGFVYSVGISPSNTAAAIAALHLMQAQPERLQRLKDRARFFLDRARHHGLNTGLSAGTPIVPVITGDSVLAVSLSNALHDRGIHVPPIMYPAVKEKEARLRFFLSAEHTDEQIGHAVAATADEFFRLCGTNAKQAGL